MKIQTNTDSSFPNQIVSDEVKASYDYGLQVSRAIEQEWFNQGRGNGNRYLNNWNSFHTLRLYARGEQSVQKYKDELSINGDLSYLNLDWKPIPVISKFVDIVVNGMSNKSYDISAFAQDPFSVKQRTDYAAAVEQDMLTKQGLVNIKEKIGMDFSLTGSLESLPENKEELDVHLQMTTKQNVEIAEEEVINNVLAFNKYDQTKKRLAQDLTTIGIGAVKTSFNKSEGIIADYVDPANLIYSYTEDPNFEDIYYVGEVKSISLAELKKQFPSISLSELEKIQDMPGNSQYVTNWGNYDANTIQVLYFEYKTYSDQVFKIKKTEQGLEKTLEKSDTFNPPENDNFERVSRTIEVLYSGAKVLGTNTMLKWEMAENMTRPTADTTKVMMNYCISAPRMYKGRIESIVSKITSFADMIQITHLKLQQVMSRIVPDGVFLDMDGLAEVDLGNGTTYNPAEALNMYFQTGSVVGRSLTQDGELNRGKIPVQELSSSSGQAKIQSLIGTYQYYLQMIRDVTGLNEARDGSAPSKDALVGLQKIAANASNIATKHVLDSLLYLTVRTCENISLKVADVIENPLTENALTNAISTFNTKTLEELMNLQLHDFGIYLELEPEEEEKALLEQNIQVALQTQAIQLSDAIDIRQIKNIKLANQFLKLRQTQKIKREQEQQQKNIQAQAQANAESAEKAAMYEVQKQQALTAEKVSIEQAKSQFEIQRMQTEAQIKRELMAEEFQYNIQLAQAQMGAAQAKEQEIEDRKDKRIKMQGTQQSELINQRQTDGLPKDFESSGNDVLGGFGLEQFGPR
ncbi:hypothetical protein N9Q05_00760 [bacterium]|nr:hypothetical protein [bacterium]MDB4298039.1 hypothetical protein [bacterium]